MNAQAAAPGRHKDGTAALGARIYSLAYLTSNLCTPPQAIRLAGELGYTHVGLRLLPNATGAPQQFLINQPEVLRETVAAQKDTGVGVFDLEIIRIGDDFDPSTCLPLLEAGAALRAKAVLVAPSVVKAGFIFGGSGGRAAMWSAKAVAGSSPGRPAGRPDR